MISSSRPVALSVALVASLGLAACGSDADSAATEDAAPETAAPAAAADEADPDDAAAEDEHGDEDHDDDKDDDHGDDDRDDHGDDDRDEDHDEHGDEDHDDDKDDDDKDDDHGDEDHDEHGDEHADDEDHDEHGDEDHDHDDESGGLGAHEHGTAELTVAWIGDEVTVDLISPNFNVFGFEYEPTSDEDLAIEEDRMSALTADGVVTVNDEAGCSLPDPVGTEIERDGSHSEITASWRFVCARPDDITAVDFAGLFEEFPGFEDVDAQWISETEQSSAELSPSETSLTLRG